MKNKNIILRIVLAFARILKNSWVYYERSHLSIQRILGVKGYLLLMSFLIVGSLFVILLGVFRPSWTPNFLLSNSAKHTSEDEAFFLQIEQNEKALSLFIDAITLYNQENYEDAVPKFTDLIEKYSQSSYVDYSIVGVVLSLHKNNKEDEISDDMNKFEGQFPEKELVQKILPLYANGMKYRNLTYSVSRDYVLPPEI